jgi:TPR repeat protein
VQQNLTAPKATRRFVMACALVAGLAIATSHAEPALANPERAALPDAQDLYRAATEDQDPSAMFALGVTFDEGLGVQIDEQQALRWFTLAAERGHAESMNRLGIFYAQGRGIPQDFVAALAWYQKSAANGSLAAVGNVATMYFYGFGVPQDYAKAAGLLKVAANQGDPGAQAKLGAMYNDGLGVRQDLRASRDLFRQAADKGYPPAMAYLGRMYTEAIGGKEDDVQGYALLQAALKLGVPASMSQIAYYELGLATARLDPKQLAAARGISDRLSAAGSPPETRIPSSADLEGARPATVETASRVSVEAPEPPRSSGRTE